jgi:hypothetical protein
VAKKASRQVALVERADSPSVHEQIAALAYALWQERGCPEGSPEQDWLKAEDELKAKIEGQAGRNKYQTLRPALASTARGSNAALRPEGQAATGGAKTPAQTRPAAAQPVAIPRRGGASPRPPASRGGRRKD